MTESFQYMLYQSVLELLESKKIPHTKLHSMYEILVLCEVHGHRNKRWTVQISPSQLEVQPYEITEPSKWAYTEPKPWQYFHIDDPDCFQKFIQAVTVEGSWGRYDHPPFPLEATP